MIGAVLHLFLVFIGINYFAEIVYLLLALTSLKGIDAMKYWNTSYLAGYLLVQALVVSASPDSISMLIIMIGLFIIVHRLARSLV